MAGEIDKLAQDGGVGGFWYFHIKEALKNCAFVFLRGHPYRRIIKVDEGAFSALFNFYRLYFCVSSILSRAARSNHFLPMRIFCGVSYSR